MTTTAADTSCPQCGKPMLSAQDGNEEVLLCYPCQQVRPVNGVEMPPRGAERREGTKPARLAMPQAETRSEAVIVQEIKQALETRGYLVLRLGQWRADKGGTDAGVPDLLVSHNKYSGFFIGMEVKTATGKLSPRQRELHRAGYTWLVRSAAEALDIVEGEDEG